MPTVETAHLYLDVLYAVATGAWILFGLLIRNALADIKLTQEKNKATLLAEQQNVKDDLETKHAELIEGQHNLVTDFNAKHAENARNIAVHQAEDTQKFESLGRTLNRIDNKLDKIANGK